MNLLIKAAVILISFAALLLVALSAPLHRFGIIDLGTSFIGFKYSVYTGITALFILIVVLIVQFLFKRKVITFANAATVVVFAGIAIAVPLTMMNRGSSVPPIHDISTDMVNPPEFVAIVPLRADAPNPVEYEGELSAAQQRQAYPDLKTLSYVQPKAELIKAAAQAANNLGWEMVNTDANQGLVEATDTTTWFGFKDDVVIRVQDKGDKRVVDIRSKSRMGASDLGKNAERIRAFIKELNVVLGE